jgi:hypothetical protein
VAAGDVLVTIKAKYESVTVALDQLSKIDTVVKRVNKTGLNFNVKGASRDIQGLASGIDKVANNLERAKREAYQFKDTALIFNQLGSTINRITGQIRGAGDAFNSLETGAKKTEAGLQIIASTFKKIRLENEAMQKAGTKLFRDSDKGGKAGSKNVLQNWSTLMKEIRATGVEGEVNLQKIATSLEEVNFLLDYAIEDGKKWNDLIKLRNDLLASQTRLQDKINGKVKESVVLEAQKGKRGPFIPKTSDPISVAVATRAQQIKDRSIYKADGQLDPAARDWNILLRKNKGVSDSIYDLATRIKQGLEAVVRNLQVSDIDKEKMIDKIRIDDILRDLSYDPKRLGPGRTSAGVPGELGPFVGGGGGYKGLLTDTKFARAIRMMEDAGKDVFKVGDTAKGVNTNFDNLKRSLTEFRREVQRTTGAMGGPGEGLDAAGPMQGPRRANLQERFNRRFGEDYGAGWGGGKRFPNRRFRDMRRGMRRNLGSKMGQSMLLGGGFPMLFGGGAGAVGGSLMGSGLAGMIGMPSAAFGLQIAGSAIGTIVEGSIRKTKELGDALNDLSMDKLVDSGIRLSSELQTQVELLEKQGQYAEARALMEEQVYSQTGANKEVLKDISNAVNIVASEWSDFANTAGALLGVVFTPILAALGAILRAVTYVLKKFNELISAVRDLGGAIYNLLPNWLRSEWEEYMNSMDAGLQKARAASAAYNRELIKNILNLRELIKHQTGMKPGYTVEERIFNVNRKMAKSDSDIDKERDLEWKKLLKENKKAWSDTTKAAVPIGGKTTIGEVLKEISRINFNEQTRLMKSSARIPFLQQRLKLEDQQEILGIRGRFEQQRFTRRNTANFNITEANRLGQTQLAKKYELEYKAFEIKSKTMQLATEMVQKDIQLSNSVEYRNKLAKYRNDLMKVELQLGDLLSDQQVRLNALYAQIAQTIRDGMVTAIEAAIEGTKTLGEVASNVFRSIARMMLQYGVTAGLKGIFPKAGFLKGLSGGGTAHGGSPYIVGEKGPELFIPGRTGTVVPNSAISSGDNIVVNVDAGGSSAEGDSDRASQLGAALGAAIQAELIKQKRPGGLLV